MSYQRYDTYHSHSSQSYNISNSVLALSFTFDAFVVIVSFMIFSRLPGLPLFQF